VKERKTMIYTTGIAVLIALASTVYIADRGLANSLERLAIGLLRYARYLRNRRRMIERKQEQQLLEHMKPLTEF
jgi:hypothetical protein